METNKKMKCVELVVKFQAEILADWVREQQAALTLRSDLLSAEALKKESQEFLTVFTAGIKTGNPDPSSAGWDEARKFMASASKSRAEKGFTASETATFIFSLKQPLFNLLKKEMAGDPQLFEELWALTALLDKLGLSTFEAFLKAREGVINRQQAELMELSTPVVELWEGVLALPLIGVLDSARTQVVMETLLQRIVETGSAVAIIDITGVPAVDTQVGQHLIKTVSAARLMGADCLISGIRPQIAQTMVHLGINFNDILTRASLADALALAFDKLALKVVKKA